MFNILSILIGLLALLLAIPAAIPLLGWANWFVTLPLLAIGLLFGMLSEKNSGRNFCLVVLALVALRLWIGGGII
jgi:hypothetical protein